MTAPSLLWQDPLPRFLDRISYAASGCWLWTGRLNSAGYGRISAQGKRQYAHRWSYEHFVGPIPDGLHIDHLCRTPACVNPAHLEPVTARENILRGESPGAIVNRTNICRRGHRYTLANTYFRPDGAGRECRACIRIRTARVSARRAAARAAA